MPIGTVERVEADYAIVTIERQDMCGECHACEMIGEVKKCEIRCVNHGAVKIKDRVEIDLANQTFLKATALMYGLPLVSLLVGLGMGLVVPEDWGSYGREMAMLGGGLGLMTLSFMWIRKKDRNKQYRELLPRIKRIL